MAGADGVVHPDVGQDPVLGAEDLRISHAGADIGLNRSEIREMVMRGQRDRPVNGAPQGTQTCDRPFRLDIDLGRRSAGERYCDIRRKEVANRCNRCDLRINLDGCATMGAPRALILALSDRITPPTPA